MPIIMFLRGAMGAGKSTTLRLLEMNLCDAAVLIEVDEIKDDFGHLNGTFRTKAIFEKTGELARDAFSNGIHAIVVEPLCDQQHINWVLGKAGISDQSNVPSVWLECSLEIAVRRKPKFPRSEVVAQHSRYPNRVRLLGELVIDTDATDAQVVAERVLMHFRKHMTLELGPEF